MGAMICYYSGGRSVPVVSEREGIEMTLRNALKVINETVFRVYGADGEVTVNYLADTSEDHYSKLLWIEKHAGAKVRFISYNKTAERMEITLV